MDCAERIEAKIFGLFFNQNSVSLNNSVRKLVIACFYSGFLDFPKIKVLITKIKVLFKGFEAKIKVLNVCIKNKGF